MKNITDIGWKFDNSYARLPELMSTRLNPVPVKSPKLIILNYELAKELELDFSFVDNVDLSLIFSGNALPIGTESIAQAYAGHQFGHFTILGDGRAVVIGEHITKKNKRFDIQFKGSGKTPYSRNGDGRAALGPMLREYIISEAMYGLNIPTTRSLAVVKTGEDVIRETVLKGAILTRVAESHIRVGTFQYIAAKGDLKTLKMLVSYSINRHYPNYKDTENSALALFKCVMEKQIELIVNWMRVGFIHGVMNTDNTTISGETIDYGPCAFIDIYKPDTVFSSIDLQGRYAFFNQPVIIQWNLSRFAEALLPLIDKDENKAIIIAEECINDFNTIYKKKWLEMMKKKIGLFRNIDEDENLIKELLLLMKKNKADFTNTFLNLSNKNLNNEFFKNKLYSEWIKKWKFRLNKNKEPIEKSLALMQNNNPSVIPRNHKVEEVLNAANNDDNFEPMYNLLDILKKPYDYTKNIKHYQSPPDENQKVYQTFCGT
tara:strand:+ start:150 stop:1613 length:1464 start_codon:yes stop_codon:yes gene_type:complete